MSDEPTNRELMIGESVRTDLVVTVQDQGIKYLYTLGPSHVVARALGVYREQILAPFVKLSKTLELRGSEHMELRDAIAKARGE